MDYTDIQAVEAYILKDIDSGFEARVSMWIKAMSRYADNQCNRVLCLVPTDSDEMLTENVYDGENTDIVLIADCNSIAEVKLDGNVITNYKAYPANKPWKSRIILESGRFTKGQQNISVKAVHSVFNYLPDDIKFAVTVLVGGICNNQIFQAKGKSETIGNYTITYDASQSGDVATAKQILSSYKRIAF